MAKRIKVKGYTVKAHDRAAPKAPAKKKAPGKKAGSKRSKGGGQTSLFG